MGTRPWSCGKSCGLRVAFSAVAKSATGRNRDSWGCATCNPQLSSVFMFCCKCHGVSAQTSWCFRKSPSRLSQMLYDGLYFRYQESAALGVVIQVLQFGHQRRTTDNPAVECLLCSLGTAAREVEQSQFGLAIRTESKHVFGVLSYEF